MTEQPHVVLNGGTMNMSMNVMQDHHLTGHYHMEVSNVMMCSMRIQTTMQ